jgi:hypothetical protein
MVQALVARRTRDRSCPNRAIPAVLDEDDIASMSASLRRLMSFAAGCLVLTFAGVAVAASTDPQINIDPIDQAWADSIVLTPADVGKSWSADPASDGGSTSDDSSSDSTWCPEGTPDQSDLIATGGVSSSFKRADSSVSSIAIVWQTWDQAQADWDRTLAVMPAQLKCLTAIFKGSTTGIKAVVTAKGPLAFPAVAPRTTAYRIRVVFHSTGRAKKKRKQFTATLDTVVLGNGRASAWIFLDWFNSKPLTGAYERSLAEKMAARMATDPAATPAP